MIDSTSSPDLRKPRIVGKRADEQCLTPASIHRTIEPLRHMLNWAVGREYLETTPFKRGTEALIKKLREDTSAAGGSQQTKSSDYWPLHRRTCGR